MIDKRGLQRFSTAVNYLSSEDDEYRSVIGNALADEGRNIANDEFNKSKSNENVAIQVFSNEIGSGKYEVVASGDTVMFAEFGTGVVGEQGNYQGDLYEGNLTFVSRGQILSTDGYVYNYYKKLYDKTAEDWKGYEPIAGLWKAGNYLRENCGEIAKEALKGTRYGAFKK